MGRRLARALVACVGLCPVAALAQVLAPSQVTPPSLRPSITQSTDTDRTWSPAAPTIKSELKVKVSRVLVVGGFAELEQETQALVAPFANRTVTVTQLSELAAAIEQSYAREGFILARVVLKPQELVDGSPVTFSVVDGYLEDVVVEQVPIAARSVVLRYASSLIGKRHPRKEELERQILLAGDISGLHLKSTLAPGRNDGGARLILDGTLTAVATSVSADNRLPVILGGWQSNATLTLNSRLGFGEQLYVYLGGSKSRVLESSEGSILVYGAGMIVPIGADGLTINPEATRTLSTTPVRSGAPASEGYFERFALRVSYPLIKTRAQTLEMRGGIERVEQVLDATDFATTLSHDVGWVVRAGANWSQAVNSTVSIDLGVMYSNGIAGRSPEEAAREGIPLSQAGASPLFEKLAGTALATAKLPYSSELHVFGTGQFSFGVPLLKAEKLSLDGAQTLSTFESGALTVDAGAAVRGEITHAIGELGLPFGIQIEPYAFLAAGFGRNEQPSAVEDATLHAFAQGIGVRLVSMSVPTVASAKIELELSHAAADVYGLESVWKGAIATSVTF